MKLVEVKRVSVIKTTAPIKYGDIEIAQPIQTDGNWKTILVGQNGSRKSYLLTMILNAAVGRTTVFSGKVLRHQLETVGGKISKVIALSATPFDRFPRKTIYAAPGISAILAKNDKYIYLGPKAPNGALSTIHGMKTLAALLFMASSQNRNYDGLVAPFDF
ncbi:hypothetical protein [Variovorax sp. R-27]|uniref:hypothetical protein n=1 Tax=Variovorax sp. R-27 TaxID=3404058 RepID=UPI003CE81969